jgi:predicted small lipoprotein YifL
MRIRLLSLAALIALLALAACVPPARNTAPAHDDTRDVSRPDRGMRDSHMM